MRVRVTGTLLLVALGVAIVSCGRAPTGPLDDPWRFVPGHVETFSYTSFRGGRKCQVYLPPGYATSDRRYPVLYLNDGEIAFDGTLGMHADRSCEALIRRGEIEPLIIVAIHHGTQAERFFDYSPWPTYCWGTPTGGGDIYVRAVRDTLKPEIDRRYRTLSDSRNTAMVGMSLGGQISAYAGFAYPGTFGKIGGFSPTYGCSNLHALVDSVGRPRTLVRYYHDTGYPRDNSINDMTSLMLRRGFTLGLNLQAITIAGGEHEVNFWERRFPEMLKFLFRAS